MFALRNWRANVLGDGLLRARRFCSSSPAAGRGPSSRPYRSRAVHPARVGRATSKCYSHATVAEFKCWNCQTISDTRPSLFCKTCSLIQSTERQNFDYFELFNVDNRYDVDAARLTSNFRKLQNLVHPDRFSNKTEAEKALSESFSSLLNKAFTTLMDPLLRGVYMLNVRGLSIEEASITMDNSFLGEIMEWNEQVEEADSKESLENIKKDVDEILLNLYKELSRAFSENDSNRAKMLLSKAKYFTTLLAKIKEINMF